MKKYKVQITKENFRDFAEYYNADKKRVEDALELLRKEQNVTNYRQDFYKKAERMFNTHFMRHDSWKYTFSLEDKNNQTLEILVNYCAEHNLTWHVDSMTEHYLYISFSDNHMFWDKSFCTMVEMPDYDALSLGEIRARLGNNDAAESLPAEISSLSGIQERVYQHHLHEQHLAFLLCADKENGKICGRLRKDGKAFQTYH